MTAPDADWSAGRPLFWGFLTVALLVGGLGGWSVFTTLAGAIVAPGQIEVSQNRQVEGDRVAAGDILLRLDGSALRSELAIVENQLLELGARRARLAAQSGEATGVVFPASLLAAAEGRADVAEIVAGQDSLFRKQAEALAQARDQRQTQIRQIDSQITGLIAQEEAIATQMRLLAEELVIQRDLLARGLSQAPRVSALERELAQLKGQAGGLTSARAEAAGRITEIEIEITALVTQSRETAEAELRDVVARELELQERQGALQDRIARLDVRAPASGLVLGLTVTTPQSVIRTADALMFVVPQDRPLLVAARVPVTHVDEVDLGRRAGRRTDGAKLLPRRDRA